MKLLAHVNVARMRGPLDAPEMRGFVAAFDPVHRIAEESPGFVWRLAGGHAVAALDGSAVHVVNVSLWRSYPDLHAFVYRSAHGLYVRNRERWFLPTRQPSTALWWIAPEHRPDVEEALRRLRYLRTHGPTAHAFSLRRRFTAEGVRQSR